MYEFGFWLHKEIEKGIWLTAEDFITINLGTKWGVGCEILWLGMRKSTSSHSDILNLHLYLRGQNWCRKELGAISWGVVASPWTGVEGWDVTRSWGHSLPSSFISKHTWPIPVLCKFDTIWIYGRATSVMVGWAVSTRGASMVRFRYWDPSRFVGFGGATVPIGFFSMGFLYYVLRCGGLWRLSLVWTILVSGGKTRPSWFSGGKTNQSPIRPMVN